MNIFHLILKMYHKPVLTKTFKHCTK
uniref:Uncharacterized protein n=1 Tax=Anguilla anguilla TaxID=7936 RepID=A0A0E9PXM4_ANGAN